MSDRMLTLLEHLPRSKTTSASSPSSRSPSSPSSSAKRLSTSASMASPLGDYAGEYVSLQEISVAEKSKDGKKDTLQTTTSTTTAHNDKPYDQQNAQQVIYVV